jgi:hypothetical protein
MYIGHFDLEGQRLIKVERFNYHMHISHFDLEGQDLKDYQPAPREVPTVYPGKRPKFSFLFYGHAVYPINVNEGKRLGDSTVAVNGKDVSLNTALEELNAAKIEERYLIISYGSNVNPVQLSLKFQKPEHVIPMFKGRLRGYDIVYAAQMAPYGSVPATIEKSENTDIEIWISLLDNEQLKIMDETENRGKSYWLVQIDDELTLENREYLSTFYSYISTRGILAVEGRPARLTEINASGAKYKAMTETEVLEYIHSNLTGRKVSDDLQRFLKRIRNDSHYYRKVDEFLRKHTMKSQVKYNIIPLAEFPLKQYGDLKGHY